MLKYYPIWQILMRTISKKPKKALNRFTAIDSTMKKGNSLVGKRFFAAIREAQKDPGFINDMRRFVKASTKVYKLK